MAQKINDIQLFGHISLFRALKEIFTESNVTYTGGHGYNQWNIKIRNQAEHVKGSIFIIVFDPVPSNPFHAITDSDPDFLKIDTDSKKISLSIIGEGIDCGAGLSFKLEAFDSEEFISELKTLIKKVAPVTEDYHEGEHKKLQEWFVNSFTNSVINKYIVP